MYKKQLLSIILFLSVVFANAQTLTWASGVATGVNRQHKVD